MDNQTVTTIIGVSAGILFVIIGYAIYKAGWHSRQHWETDRITEGKLDK